MMFDRVRKHSLAKTLFRLSVFVWVAVGWEFLWACDPDHFQLNSDPSFQENLKSSAKAKAVELVRAVRDTFAKANKEMEILAPTLEKTDEIMDFRYVSDKTRDELSTRLKSLKDLLSDNPHLRAAISLQLQIEVLPLLQEDAFAGPRAMIEHVFMKPDSDLG